MRRRRPRLGSQVALLVALATSGCGDSQTTRPPTVIECLKGTGGDVFSVQHANEPRIIHVVSPHIEIINVYLARTEAEASKVIGEEATGRARAHMRAGRRIVIFHDDPHSDWARKVKPCVRLSTLGDYSSLPNY